MLDLPSLAKELTLGSAGVWTGVLMFAGYIFRGWLQTRKMSLDERMAKREGFTRQVELLTAENRKLREDLVASDRRHDEYRRICQQENDQLRDQVIGLEDRIAGLLRKIADVAVRMARGDVGPEVAASLLQLAAEAQPPAPEGKGRS